MHKPFGDQASDPSSATTPNIFVPKTLAELSRAEAECRRCSLYQAATQVVPGAAPRHGVLMLVGEQPGDHEDKAGKPFVGPAGRTLDKALEAAGIARGKVFLTNAVKHFKHEQRGKRRLHKRPSNEEIERCQWWLDLERRLVRPGVIVAMGATAVRSLFGRSIRVASIRSRPQRLTDGTAIVVTVHPSYVLRLRDEAVKEREFQKFVADLHLAARLGSAADCV
jgi:uracil-DNA glycosylase